MKIKNSDVLYLIHSLEKHFGKKYPELTKYVIENNFEFEENNQTFCFTGYSEIHDFFRVCVNFRELEVFRYDFYKIEIKGDKIIFYDFYDKILFEKPFDQKVDLKNVPYKALSKFYKDGV